MKSKDILYTANPPWIILSSNTEEDHKWMPHYLYSGGGLRCVVRIVRGTKMRTHDALMTEFGAALQFFDGFGENWEALRDCLQCLDELYLDAQAFIILVTHSEELLADDKRANVKLFFKKMNTAGEFLSTAIEDGDRYDRPPIPFHVVLKCDPKKTEAVRSVLIKNSVNFEELDPDSIRNEEQ